jgi:AraC-like DNA-binding protein
LIGYPELVVQLGGDPAPLLRRAGIPRRAVGDIDAFIGFRNAVAAIESAAATTKTADFGRQLANRQGIDILGPVGAAARTAPTVGAALTAIGRYMAVYSPGIAVTVAPEVEAARARIEYRILLDNIGDCRQTIELALGIGLRIFRLLVDSRFAPLVVHLPHRPVADKANYNRYFATRIRFAEPWAAFTIQSADLRRHIAADSGVHDTVVAYLDSVAPAHSADLVQQVRTLIRHLLGTGTLNIALVARHFAMHPRALQRRLANQSTSFEQLIDDVRCDLTRTYLRDTDMPLAQLAEVLGYSQQSVLSRSCQRWFGANPREQRRALRTASVASPVEQLR